MSDLISVIIPVYKVEDYIRRCIDSITNQTYSNIEIILIDDGSPDLCGQICDEYASQDSRIKVIHKKNGGLSDARNVGIDIATGQYITFLDSDDWVHKRYLETLYDLMKNINVDISMCNFHETFVTMEDLDVEEKEILEYSNIEALRQFTDKYYVQMTVAWGKLYKAGLFEDIRFPLGKIHEDEFTTYKLIYKARKIIFTTEPLLYYFQRQDSIMGSGFKIKNRLHTIEAFEERAEFFNKIDQGELRDKTYKQLFGIYVNVYDHIDMFEDEISKSKYMNDFNSFKTKLRSSKQSFKFKLYYELYFISPKLGQVVQVLNRNIRG